MLFKALQHIQAANINYVPGDIIPDAASFPNLKELIEWRMIGYPTSDEIKAYKDKNKKNIPSAEKETELPLKEPEKGSKPPKK
ncbi:hypothetical protein [Pectinatus frisingensis]|uniref:hypothetical protein n=1 Tax=Pectinatus frisingensis TaxID=865 RepID=UPI0018C8043E|nr:hypothetical protein [Pectinatus frisingensis]